MPLPLNKIPVGSTRRKGFSLVLSLTVMAMLLLICIGAASLLALELRSAKAGVGFARAKMNAIASARVALGTLQGLSGLDRRITASASILDTAPATPNLSDDIKLPHLTGVWKGQSVSSSYSATHNNALLGWLASGAPQATTLAAYPKTSDLVSSGIRLFRAPATTPAAPTALTDNDAADVYATPEAVVDAAGSASGKIAWWISDENQKANLGLRKPTGTTAYDALAGVRNTPRFGLKLAGDGDLANFPETRPFNTGLVTRESLAFDSDTPTSPWLSNPGNYFHSITPYSESLLTDAANGGLKYDLSLMFAANKLPDGYWGNTGYVGLESKVPTASVYAKAKGKWLATGPASALSPTALPVNNQKEWTCWGDVWNYARLYRHPSFSASSGMMTTTSVEAHGSGGANLNTTLDPSANVIDQQNMAAWREPVITQVQMVLGYRVKPNASDATKYDLYMVMRPYIQLWNPYNVPLRFTGNEADSILGRIVSLPGRVEIKYDDSVAGTKTYVSNSWSDFLSQSGNFNVYQPYINYQTTTVMAPGEVRVFSPTTNAIQSATKVDMTSGLRPFGGFETKVTAVTPFNGNVTATVYAPTGAWYGQHVWADWGRARWTSIYQKSSPGRGWTVPYVATDAGASKQIMDFDSTPVTSTIPQLSGAGRFCALITMRLRSETLSTLAFPYLQYGDPLRAVYSPLATKNFKTNQDVWLSPYEFVHSKITSDTDAPPSNPVMNVAAPSSGYAFTGYTPTFGINRMVYSHIPLAPLASLGDLKDARLGGGAAYSRNYSVATGSELVRMTTGASVVQNAFGNSFMHPLIAPTAITGVSGTFANETFYDFSWITNSDLWDAYCVTGLTPQDTPVTALLPGGAPKTLAVVASEFFEQGKDLPNARLKLNDYGIGTTAMKALVVSGNVPATDAYAKAAAMATVRGGFNINSTSVRAWRALLSGLNGTAVPTTTGATTTLNLTTESLAGVNPVLTAPVQSGPLADINTGGYSQAFNAQRGLAGRKLSDDQITALAQNIVQQVKLRGPFLSLGEFINRRLETGALGEKGALQAAIDASGVNAFSASGSVRQVLAGDIASLALANTTPALGSVARGMPGVISQSDLVAPLASVITPRSDTFTIRAYGSTDEGASAYVELTVRRGTAFIDPSDQPFTVLDSLTKPANKAFGRRYVIVASRWLKDDEV